jgi:hypothetical protein
MNKKLTPSEQMSIVMKKIRNYEAVLAAHSTPRDVVKSRKKKKKK